MGKKFTQKFFMVAFFFEHKKIKMYKNDFYFMLILLDLQFQKYMYTEKSFIDLRVHKMD